MWYETILPKIRHPLALEVVKQFSSFDEFLDTFPVEDEQLNNIRLYRKITIEDGALMLLYNSLTDCWKHPNHVGFHYHLGQLLEICTEDDDAT